MLYLFNPENDLALANFSSTYTPPASAMTMAEDLALLPLWYAPNNTAIWAKNRPENEIYLKNFSSLFGKNFSLVFGNTIPNNEIVPWGWSPRLRKQLLDLGIASDILPSLTDIQRIRDYSHRTNAVRLLSDLQSENTEYCGSSHYFTHIDDLLRWLMVQKEDCVLKMPLSGSGKGLVWILGKITDKQTDWANRVIRMQGGVVAEIKLKKQLDFAMEFRLHSGKARFEGYSLFEATESGAYKGNRLMSDDEIEKIIAQSVSIAVMQQLQHKLLEKLPLLFPFYDGFLGVDMMLCNTPLGTQIHPCVEINLRMNMGLVAHGIYRDFVHPLSTGKFTIAYFKKSGEALAHHIHLSQHYPLVMDEKTIVSGYLNLTPVSEATQYVAQVEIVKK